MHQAKWRRCWPKRRRPARSAKFGRSCWPGLPTNWTVRDRSLARREREGEREATGRERAANARTIGIGDLSAAGRAERTAGGRDGKEVSVVDQRAGQRPRIGIAAVGREACHRRSRAATAADEFERAVETLIDIFTSSTA